MFQGLLAEMAAPIAEPTERKHSGMYHSLVESHCLKHGLTFAEFFRTAHYWKFNRDIPAVWCEVKRFSEEWIVPPYAVDYIKHVYGVS